MQEDIYHLANPHIGRSWDGFSKPVLQNEKTLSSLSTEDHIAEIDAFDWMTVPEKEMLPALEQSSIPLLDSAFKKVPSTHYDWHLPFSKMSSELTTSFYANLPALCDQIFEGIENVTVVREKDYICWSLKDECFSKELVRLVYRIVDDQHVFISLQTLLKCIFKDLVFLCGRAFAIESVYEKTHLSQPSMDILLKLAFAIRHTKTKCDFYEGRRACEWTLCVNVETGTPIFNATSCTNHTGYFRVCQPSHSGGLLLDVLKRLKETAPLSIIQVVLFEGWYRDVMRTLGNCPDLSLKSTLQKVLFESRSGFLVAVRCAPKTKIYYNWSITLKARHDLNNERLTLRFQRDSRAMLDKSDRVCVLARQDYSHQYEYKLYLIGGSNISSSTPKKSFVNFETTSRILGRIILYLPRKYCRLRGLEKFELLNTQTFLETFSSEQVNLGRLMRAIGLTSYWTNIDQYFFKRNIYAEFTMREFISNDIRIVSSFERLLHSTRLSFDYSVQSNQWRMHMGDFGKLSLMDFSEIHEIMPIQDNHMLRPSSHMVVKQLRTSNRWVIGVQFPHQAGMIILRITHRSLVVFASSVVRQNFLKIPTSTTPKRLHIDALRENQAVRFELRFENEISKNGAKGLKLVQQLTLDVPVDGQDTSSLTSKKQIQVASEISLEHVASRFILHSTQTQGAFVSSDSGHHYQLIAWSQRHSPKSADKNGAGFFAFKVAQDLITDKAVVVTLYVPSHALHRNYKADSDIKARCSEALVVDLQYASEMSLQPRNAPVLEALKKWYETGHHHLIQVLPQCLVCLRSQEEIKACGTNESWWHSNECGHAICDDCIRVAGILSKSKHNYDEQNSIAESCLVCRSRSASEFVRTKNPPGRLAFQWPQNTLTEANSSVYQQASDFVYRLGDLVMVNDFDMSQNSCTNGIHFFPTLCQNLWDLGNIEAPSNVSPTSINPEWIVPNQEEHTTSLDDALYSLRNSNNGRGISINPDQSSERLNEFWDEIFVKDYEWWGRELTSSLYEYDLDANMIGAAAATPSSSSIENTESYDPSRPEFWTQEEDDEENVDTALTFREKPMPSLGAKK